MSDRKSHDRDNPEWIEEDFRAARPAADLPKDIAAAFPRTRGTQKAPTKKAVSLRLDADVIEKFRATGRGWQSRINEVLKNAKV